MESLALNLICQNRAIAFKNVTILHVDNSDQRLHYNYGILQISTVDDGVDVALWRRWVNRFRGSRILAGVGAFFPVHSVIDQHRVRTPASRRTVLDLKKPWKTEQWRSAFALRTG